MVCSFMLIVLPAVIMRIIYWVWGLISGKKPEPVKAAEPTTAGEQEVKKGTCPYHVVMNFLGYPVPDKKKPEATAPANAESTPCVDEPKATELKSE